MRNTIIRVAILAAVILAVVASLCGCQSPEQKFADERMTQEEFTALYNERGDAVLSDQVKALFPSAHFDIKVLDFRENFNNDGVLYDITISQDIAIGDASKVDWKKVCLASRAADIHHFAEEDDVIASFNTDHRIVNVSPVYTYSGGKVDEPGVLNFVDNDGGSYTVYQLAVYKDTGNEHYPVWTDSRSSDTETSTSSKSTQSSGKKSTGKNTTKQKCFACNGTGYVKYYAGEAGSDYTYGTCTECNGTGYAR